MTAFLTVLILCIFITQILKPEQWLRTFVAFLEKVLNKRIGGE